MSDLRPTGSPVMVDGVERYLLFTLNAIDQIQDTMDLSLEEVMDTITDKRKSNGTLKTILTVLLNDEVDRVEYRKEKTGLQRYTEQETGWLICQENMTEIIVAILKAYGLSLPETDEEEPPNQESGQQSQ